MLGAGWGMSFRKGRDENVDALAAYVQATAVAPHSPDAWLLRGDALGPIGAFSSRPRQPFGRPANLTREMRCVGAGLATVLADHLGRLDEAEAAYGRALECEPTSSMFMANLAYLLLGQSGRQQEGDAVCAGALEALPEPGAGLLKAYRALVHDNFGEAVLELGRVLQEGHKELFGDFEDDLMRFLRMAKERGVGPKLLLWFDESGMGDRYWPLRTAFDAHVNGSERLRDVNPEVRGAAQRIFGWA